jgi:hypothetical protein
MEDKKQNEFQIPIDMLLFYTALFYKLARKNQFTRKDFQDLIVETCNYLPVRGGGSGEDGFWANVCKTHEVQIVFRDGHIDDETVLRLADAMWLVYDQDLRNEVKRQKELS